MDYSELYRCSLNGRSLNCFDSELGMDYEDGNWYTLNFVYTTIQPLCTGE